MNKNQIEVKLNLPINHEPYLTAPGKLPLYGPFCVRFMNGHSNIVRDLGPAHVNIIMETCEGRCLLNLNDDLTPEILDGKKVLSISMLMVCK